MSIPLSPDGVMPIIGEDSPAVPVDERTQLLAIARDVVWGMAAHKRDAGRDMPTERDLTREEDVAYRAALGLLTKEFNRGYRDAKADASP